VITPTLRRTLFALFFVSGTSGLIDQVVWTRMAFASFGVIAPVLSVVLSVFMLGLAVGSWAGGRAIGPLVRRTGVSAAAFYGGAELLIGVGAVIVPALFAVGQRLLLPTGAVDSARYLMLSAAVLATAIFPWCLFMGTTFPFMMAYVAEAEAGAGNGGVRGSFSFLYLANVLGAMVGTLATAAVLIERFGFRHTLWVAAGGNAAVAAVGFALAAAAAGRRHAAPPPARPAPPAARAPGGGWGNRAVLFTTGFASMAMEVVWTREFAAVLKTQVYSFALIVFTYLAATAAGSLLYRRDVRRGRRRPREPVLFWLALAALLPVAVDDPTFVVQHFQEPAIHPASAALLLGGIVPLCGLLGYLTPWLVDEESAGGHPDRAGTAYAVNVVGCILGPLVACYALMPAVSGRWALILLALPLTACWVASARRPPPSTRRRLLGRAAVLAAATGYAVAFARDFEEVLVRVVPGSVVRRDEIASVASCGRRRQDKALLVNGFGMTQLTPITKFIAHLPLAAHRGRPRSALVICFGMGTSFRSALSWGVDTTAVELVPSVPRAFGFYHADAARWLADPHGRIVIDDGRRYLGRCGRRFDVIAVDPPPPTEAAGCSLLFSTDFYALARQHLNPGGIVQMWYPGPKDRVGAAVIRSMVASFAHVRCFGSVEGWGVHMLGSDQPIDLPPADQLVARFPPAARADLLEWAGPDDTAGGGDPVAAGPARAARYVEPVLRSELDLSQALAGDPDDRVTDDRPFNEYYLLRLATGRR
jgi:spermidine synthase